MVAPWQSYLVNGDVGALGEAWDRAGWGFLNALWGHVSLGNSGGGGGGDGGGLLQPFGGSWGFLGDWLTPHGSEQSNSPEALLLNNCSLCTSCTLGHAQPLPWVANRVCCTLCPG